jgi:hypothetical protein
LRKDLGLGKTEIEIPEDSEQLKELEESLIKTQILKESVEKTIKDGTRKLEQFQGKEKQLEERLGIQSTLAL